MKSTNIAVLMLAYAFGMFMVTSVVNAQEPYPNEIQIKGFIETSTNTWLAEKRHVFSGFFELEIESEAKALFSNVIAKQLVDKTSQSIIISSFPDKKFQAKGFFENTRVFTYYALDNALVFQIYLHGKIEKVIKISAKAIQEVTKNLGCQTPPCDFKLWCGCFYSK